MDIFDQRSWVVKIVGFYPRYIYTLFGFINQISFDYFCATEIASKKFKHFSEIYQARKLSCPSVLIFKNEFRPLFLCCKHTIWHCLVGNRMCNGSTEFVFITVANNSWKMLPRSFWASKNKLQNVRHQSYLFTAKDSAIGGMWNLFRQNFT